MHDLWQATSLAASTRLVVNVKTWNEHACLIY